MYLGEKGRFLKEKMICVHAKWLSCVQLFVTPRTVAHQAPLSRDSPGKNTRVGSHALLQGIFPSQESNLCLLPLLHRHIGSLPLLTSGKATQYIFMYYFIYIIMDVHIYVSELKE